MAVDLSLHKKMIAIDLQGTIWTMPVEGGKAKALTDGLADLVIVNKDPLAHIQDSWNVEMVIKNGEAHKIEDLLQKPAGN